tara:strand:- start:801 stop:998 length:198 start_codon:yes stop_codon:yes gene_type:complete
MEGGSLIALVAVIGTTVSGILTTLFHSRCKTIKACGMECNRDVIHTKEEIDLDEDTEKKINHKNI